MKNLIMWLKTNPLISGGRAGRGDEFRINKYKARKPFDFNWWFWFPEFSHNKARADKLEVVDINFMWLCFWISITSWPLPIVDPDYLNMSDEQFTKVDKNG